MNKNTVFLLSISLISTVAVFLFTNGSPKKHDTSAPPSLNEITLNANEENISNNTSAKIKENSPAIAGSIEAYHKRKDENSENTIVTLLLEAESTDADVKQMKIWTHAETSVDWVPYNTIYTVSTKTAQTVSVKFRDSAGNESIEYRTSFSLK